MLFCYLCCLSWSMLMLMLLMFLTLLLYQQVGLLSRVLLISMSV